MPKLMQAARGMQASPSKPAAAQAGAPRGVPAQQMAVRTWLALANFLHMHCYHSMKAPDIHERVQCQHSLRCLYFCCTTVASVTWP